MHNDGDLSTTSAFNFEIGWASLDYGFPKLQDERF